MSSSLKRRLLPILHKDLILDLDDRLRAEALKAFEMVRDRSGLDRKRSRELEGQARFRMMEQGFQEICELYGGKLLEGGLIPYSDKKVFQPFMRFTRGEQGIIFALASMPEVEVLPVKNKSRLAGVSLNYYLQPRLDLDGAGPKVGDIFVLLLISRDRERAGKIEQVAVAIVNSSYDSFLYYESLDEYLVGQSSEKAQMVEVSAVESFPVVKNVSLKENIKPFMPPELPSSDEDKKIHGK